MSFIDMASSKYEQDSNDSEEKVPGEYSGKWYLTVADDNSTAADAKGNSYESDIYGADDLICRLCHKLVVDAVTTYCCDSLYCRACILSALQDTTKCPLCTKILDFGGLHPNVRAELRSRAIVRGCTHRMEGCSFRGNRIELDDHLQEDCLYSPEKVVRDRYIQLIDESKHAWETSNPHLHAFRELHFNRAIKLDQESKDEVVHPATVKFFSYSSNPSPTCISVAHLSYSPSFSFSFRTSSRTLEPEHIPEHTINSGPWKLAWLVEYRWKVHACIHIENESSVKLFIYKDMDAPSSIVASVQLLSPFGRHRNKCYSTSHCDHSKWKARHLTKDDSSVVNVWDFGEIMKVKQFLEFCYAGKFALAAMLDH